MRIACALWSKPPCGAMRGHGAVNSRYAMELLVDQLAEDAGNDPCELRLKNLLPPKKQQPKKKPPMRANRLMPAR